MCCGNKNLQRRVARIQQPVIFETGPVFEYLGRTGLTTIGAVTGIRYRFERPSARLHVHPQDSSAMAGIPGLRKIP